MALPLSYFLIAYLVFILIWLFFSGVAVYHIVRFGHKTPVTYAATTIFILVSAAMLITTFINIASIDWTRQLTIFGTFGGY